MKIDCSGVVMGTKAQVETKMVFFHWGKVIFCSMETRTLDWNIWNVWLIPINLESQSCDFCGFIFPPFLAL